ncbi:hypothetical protein DVR12_16680 [Chitinophaga silvatica]|uniref:Lipoprotein n=1 Tax=Chitinophaga silvatica TaxID=2282649 RepID=A0A3E1Y7E3_9BACT|nr:hypothetical protein [Chitinophaga silvatica]RFS20985.1 hypothetical protein DVR12_16680 [Chitinophaga silvatica]
MRLFTWLVILIFLGMGCKQAPRNVITPAFYYWKQTWDTNNSQQTVLEQLPAKRLYVKLFDVTTTGDNNILPVAVLRTKAPLPKDLEIVPVVFLMNEIWAHADSTLVTKVAELVSQQCANISNISEIQLDCDWTQTTRKAYFNFIEQIRKHPFFRHKTISATIRLYQLKYAAKAGVPPVDKGLLMCYNMGDMRKAGEHNSILDLNTLQSYIGNNTISRYSLPLDIALPLFEWEILFRQGLNYEGIVRNVDVLDPSVFSKTSTQLYTVKKDTVLNGYKLRQNDVIRHEFIDATTLKQASKLIAKQLPHGNRAVIFYHLDSLILRNYPLNELQETIQIFN